MGRWLMLGVCALLTWRQIPRFVDDVSLWRAAAVVTPQAVRPAVNLAAQAILRRDEGAARWWIARARERLAHPSRAHERGPVTALLDRQETWIDAFLRSQP